MKPFLILATLLFTMSTSSAHANTNADWDITVYYTPVEKYHTGSKVTVTGCRILDCENGTSHLGKYPKSFVQRVKDEGTGRITSGKWKGRYLNWSVGIGYWLDTIPRDARGGKLKAFRSAAADLSVPYGSRLTIEDCGVDMYTDEPISSRVCKKLMNANWKVQDRFSAGTVGNHIDLYIGEEDRKNFEGTNPYFLALTNAEVTTR